MEESRQRKICGQLRKYGLLIRQPDGIIVDKMGCEIYGISYDEALRVVANNYNELRFR